jgi:hypothetical protein
VAGAEVTPMNKEVTIQVSEGDYKRLITARAEERPAIPIFATIIEGDDETAADIHAERLKAIREGRVVLRMTGQSRHGRMLRRFSADGR